MSGDNLTFLVWKMSFVVLLPFVAVYLFLWFRTIRKIREVDPVLWESMGRPTLTNTSPESTVKLVKYIFGSGKGHVRPDCAAELRLLKVIFLLCVSILSVNIICFLVGFFARVVAKW